MDDFPRYLAPAADDMALVEPNWSNQLQAVSKPQALSDDLSFAGVTLAELKAQARRDLVAAAIEHTSQFTPVSGDPLALIEAGAPLIVGGHQPELFHPGVWFKNFALNSLAKQSSAVGLHAIIDSDLCREASIRVPTGTIDSPRVCSVAYDASLAPRPYEERRIHDSAHFDSFPAAVGEAIQPFIADPLVGRLWVHAQAARKHSENLGVVLSAARMLLQQDWGVETLEAPISAACDSQAFRCFATKLLIESRIVADSYNTALGLYRRAHRLRSAAQPLPDLARIDGWVESPLWVWTETNPIRRALFVRNQSGVLELSDRSEWTVSGPAQPEDLVAWLGELRAAGVKVRSRALVTTLFARLVLSDLFLHGIGGAKYDQVTDRFAQHWLGVAPPPHATLSATVRLPINHDAPTEADRSALARRLRDLDYHPEKFLPDAEEALRKRTWIETAKTAKHAAERHHAIRAANESLRRQLQAERSATQSRLLLVEQQLRGGALLDSREYSFSLFPEENLRRRMKELARIESE